ncbi:hypothetical protein E2C01_026627 [Portunus trituberculatus]|uniref:Uncharacterized protein n=1 Tax=Portunus trituberculatus TaxID=210409 RepID=A0A5B7EGM2_PORTR|nr:hypothetical protein [Portunus trituberculatus]
MGSVFKCSCSSWLQSTVSRVLESKWVSPQRGSKALLHAQQWRPRPGGDSSRSLTGSMNLVLAQSNALLELDPRFFNNVRATSCSEMASMNAWRDGDKVGIRLL